MYATPNTISIDGIGQDQATSLRPGAAAVTGGLPSDSSGALTVFDLGGLVHQVLTCVDQPGNSVDQGLRKLTDKYGLDLDTDILSWMHGEAVAVVGPNRGAGRTPDYSLIVTTSDQAKATAAMVKIRRALAGQGVASTPQVIAGATGYVLDSGGGGVRPAMALLPSRFIVASSPQYLAELIAHPGTLGATDDYRSVIGTGNATNSTFQFVLRVAPIREAIVANLTGAEADRYRRDVAPYVTPFKAVGVRGWQTGTTAHVQVTISFN